jgi:hypothetical protein
MCPFLSLVLIYTVTAVEPGSLAQIGQTGTEQPICVESEGMANAIFQERKAEALKPGQNRRSLQGALFEPYLSPVTGRIEWAKRKTLE